MASKDFKRQIAAQVESLQQQGKMDLSREDLEHLSAISSSIGRIAVMASRAIERPNQTEELLEDIITVANTLIAEIEDIVPSEQLIAESNIDPNVILNYLHETQYDEFD